jgi:hypothetical protein
LFFIHQYYVIHISFFQVPTTSHKLKHGNTHNLNLPLLSKPNENKNTHKPKTENPHKNPIFKAKEKNNQKKSHAQDTQKKKKIDAQKNVAETRGI